MKNSPDNIVHTFIFLERIPSESIKMLIKAFLKGHPLRIQSPDIQKGVNIAAP